MFMFFFRYLHPLLPLTLCRSHHSLPMRPDPFQCLRPFLHYIFMVISLGIHNGRGSFSRFLFWSYTMGETHIKSKCKRHYHWNFKFLRQIEFWKILMVFKNWFAIFFTVNETSEKICLKINFKTYHTITIFCFRILSERIFRRII